QLARVRDVRVEASSAQWIGRGRASIRRRFVYADRLGVRQAFSDALDTRGDALAGDRAADEHHPAVEACDHASADCRLLDDQAHRLAWCQHVTNARVKPAGM